MVKFVLHVYCKPSLSKLIGAPVAQKVKRLTADLVAAGSRPARGANFFNSERGSIAQNVSLSPTHLPDMTGILLKRT